MKSIAHYALVLMLVAGMGAPAPLPAQEAAPAAPPTVENPLSSIADLGLKRLEAEELSSEADGSIRIKGQVALETDQIKLKCNLLTVDPKTKIMRALGTPVEIEQGGMKARCNTFTYEMDKKRSTLEDSPVIYSEDKEKVTKITGDIIILTQNEKGEISWSLKRDDQNPRKMVLIETVEKNPAKTPAPDVKEAPTKVTGDRPTLDLLKLPSTE
jgi:lipopolysaccharide export system protein LptA